MKTEFSVNGVTLHLSIEEARHLYRFALSSPIRKSYIETFKGLAVMQGGLPMEEISGPKRSKNRP